MPMEEYLFGYNTKADGLWSLSTIVGHRLVCMFALQSRVISSWEAKWRGQGMVLYTFQKSTGENETFLYWKECARIVTKALGKRGAFSGRHDIRALAGLIVGLYHSVHCCLLLKQKKNPTWPIYLFSCLWCVKVSDFTWSHDGTQALISYRDGFVLVGSVSGQRHWSSEINLESQITCGIWTPDDQQVMKMGRLGVSVGYAIEYSS